MENLPDEIVSEILMRLLAKQVGQMRCVCKSWNALLSHSSFVKSHLHRSTHKNDHILLFFHDGISLDNCPFTALSSRSPNLELTNLLKLPINSLQTKNRQGHVIGSVNGLICFFTYGPSHDYSVHICNPSLSAVTTLPSCSFPSRNPYEIYLRFGYDPKTNDYKVVKFTRVQRKMVPQGEVCSMRRGSWQLISHLLPSHITWICDDTDLSVDGCDGHLHWLGSTELQGKEETIVAFDLGAETFSEIPLPHSIGHGSLCRYHFLGVMSEKLCVTSEGKDGEWEVWLMDEYGMPESWVKHYTFSQFSSDMYPYGFTSHGEFLFKDYADSFALHDPVAVKTKTFKIPSHFGIDKFVEYIDSLVWVAPAR